MPFFSGGGVPFPLILLSRAGALDPSEDKKRNQGKQCCFWAPGALGPWALGPWGPGALGPWDRYSSMQMSSSNEKGLKEEHAMKKD